jgi:hypothetical protein
VFIYVGKNFTATATGSVVKEVTCIQCADRYWYELSRFAQGVATSPYYIAQGWAASRAQRSADKKLARMLRDDCEVVPCPKCSTVQPQMMLYLRKRMYGTLRNWSYILPLVGIAIVGLFTFVYWADRNRRSESDYTPYLLAAAGCVGLSVLMSGVRKWLIARGEWIKEAMSGAPPALVREDPGNPQSALRPVPRPSGADDDSPWVTFSLLRIPLPDICCQCTAPGQTVFKTPFTMNGETAMALALCHECARQIRVRWWKYAGFTMLVLFVIATGMIAIPAYFGAKDIFAYVFGAIALMTLGGAFAVAMFPGWMVRPFEHRWVDSSRGIIRIRFDNPQFTRLFRRYVEATEQGTPVQQPPQWQRSA